MSIKTLLFHVGFVLLQEEKGCLFVVRESRMKNKVNGGDKRGGNLNFLKIMQKFIRIHEF